MATAASAQTSLSAKTGHDVTFGKNGDLTAGLAAVASHLAQIYGLSPSDAAELAKTELKDAVICAVPSSADLYYRLSAQKGVKFKHVVALTQLMPGYGGWVRNGQPPLRELLCYLNEELGNKEQGFAAGDHYVSGGFSRLGKFSSIIDAVGTVYHENVHKLFHTANRILLAALRKQGGDAIALNLFDEGNAFARTITSLYLRKLELEQKRTLSREERVLHTDISDVLVVYKDTEQARALASLVDIYGKDAVLDHVKTHGHLPAAINRFMLLGFMDDIASFKNYQSSAVDSLYYYGNNKLTLNDASIRQVMGYDGVDYYGDMPGMATHVLPHLKLMFAKTADQFKSGIEARLGSDKGIAGAINDVIGFLKHISHDSECLGASTSLAEHVVKTHRDNPVFKAEFVRQDLNLLFAAAIKRINAIPEKDAKRGHPFGRALKDRLIGVVEQVQRGILDGQPLNSALASTPLPGLTKGYHAAVCG